MTLPFSTQLKGKPTYFVEKILKGIDLKISIYTQSFWKQSTYNRFDFPLLKPKFHTFREDTKERWHAGRMIDFFINCRQSNMQRFAPTLPVISTQKVEIKWYSNDENLFVRVFIDDKSFARVDFDLNLHVSGNMLQLAYNDGFDTIEDFFGYFDKDFKGKIIHWTDLRY